MLTCLRVRDLAILSAIEVEFGPGLSVVTGETGAGKSILVEALSLVLGARPSRDVIRTGADRADIEALFEDGDEQVVLRRSLLASGRNRAYVNGALATVGELEALAARLVDLSSQHEHHTLGDPGTHQGFLDASAGLEAARDRVGTAYAALKDSVAALDAEQQRARTRVEREDLLRFQVDEIEKLALKPGEMASLEAERERLRHAETLMQAASRAEHGLAGRDGAICAALARMVGELEGAARFDPALAGLAGAVESARIDLEEAARDLGSYVRGIDADPARAEEVEARLFEARRLARKHGGTEEALLARAAAAVAELAELASSGERIEALERARDAARQEAAEAARSLSAGRRAAAHRLGDAITAELQTLGMGGARVQVEVAHLAAGDAEVVDGARLSATGIDRVEFLIAPNPGEDPRPLRKVASGGELSRALLAIKRVLAANGPVGLYVFDEVDSGVGGAVAEVIGQKLAEVARHHQVLCVTHLAQIAVYADAHYKVKKRVVDGRTISEVAKLDDRERLEELSRMLGGIEVSDAHRAAAAAMLATARA